MPCHYLVVHFCAYEYGTAIDTALTLLDDYLSIKLMCSMIKRVFQRHFLVMICLTSALMECKHSHLDIEQEQVFHKTAPSVTLKNYPTTTFSHVKLIYIKPATRKTLTLWRRYFFKFNELKTRYEANCIKNRSVNTLVFNFNG